MPLDAWFPIGYHLPNDLSIRQIVDTGNEWQLYELLTGGRALICKSSLAEQWLQSELLEDGTLTTFKYGEQTFYFLYSYRNHMLSRLSKCPSPGSKSEAIAFASAFCETRKRDNASSLQEAIYIEKYSRLLPTYESSSHVNDDILLGSFLTGGVPISIHSFRRLSKLITWMGSSNLKEVIVAAGFELLDVGSQTDLESHKRKEDQQFSLSGRPELERFLLEHVIDIIENEERYKALSIDFPSSIILHGPPGCGKTFAIEKLIDYLGWPSFQVNASSVASPYIHETSRKVAQVFEQAIQNAPSVVVIDEMEAFLTSRQSTISSGQFHVEEISEFLRCIPEANRNQVLVIAMTNHIDMIDSAILRRGRFDHIVKVDMPSEEEVTSLLEKLVLNIPKKPDIDISTLSKKLMGRPLSDVAFVVKEGARLSARTGNDKLSQECLIQAVESCFERGANSSPKVGFS